MPCKEKKVSASLKEKWTSSKFLRSPSSPGKGVSPGGKGWGAWVGPTAPILGNYPRDGIITKHTSRGFVSLTVRGAIKHRFPSGLLKAWRVGSVWKEGVASWEKENHGFLVNAAPLQAHAVFMRISEDQWDLTDLPLYTKQRQGLKELWAQQASMGCPGTVQFAQIPDMNLTQSEDVVLTWGVNLAWRYYLKCFFLVLLNHFRGG